MVRQTQMNGRQSNAGGERTGAGRAVRRGVSEIVHDVAELSSLQAQLTATDLREAGSRAVLPVICLVGAVVIALGSLPVLLLGIGSALIEQFGWAESAAYLVTGIVAMLLAVGSGWFGWAKLRSAASVLGRSKRELWENVSSIRDTLTRSELK